MEYLRKPYEFSEIMEQCKASGGTVVEGVIAIELEEIIDRDLDGFFDLLSDKLVNDSGLMDIQYEVVGHTKDGQVLVRVSGDADYIITEDDWAEAI